MSKHTSGPWSVGGKDKTIIYAGDGHAVASCAVYHGRFKDGEVEANARLIAASPELLEALDNLLSWAEDIHDPRKTTGINYHGMDLARAAIAKATNNDKGKEQ